MGVNGAIEVINKTKTPIFLFEISFNTEYIYRKYHSGTTCLGVTRLLAKIELTGLSNIRLPKNVK